MTSYTRRVLRAFGPTRRNLAVFAVAVLLLAVTHLVVPHWSTRYAAYLVVFSLWMAWFVQRVVELIDDEDDSPTPETEPPGSDPSRTGDGET